MTQQTYNAIEALMYCKQFDLEFNGKYRVYKDDNTIAYQVWIDDGINMDGYQDVIRIERDKQDMVHCMLEFLVKLESHVCNNRIPF